MLKKQITYHDFDGNQVTDTFYFHLSKAEIMELELERGLSTLMDRVSTTRNPKELYFAFKALIAKAYGEKSADGFRFEKSEALSSSFLNTDAYSELIMELMTKGDAGEFINGLIPRDLADKVQEAVSEQGATVIPMPVEKRPEN